MFKKFVTDWIERLMYEGYTYDELCQRAGGGDGGGDSSSDDGGISDAEFSAAESSFDYGENSAGQSVSGSFDSGTGMVTQTTPEGTVSYDPTGKTTSYSVTTNNGSTYGFDNTGGFGGVAYDTRTPTGEVSVTGYNDIGYTAGQVAGFVSSPVGTVLAKASGEKTPGDYLGDALAGELGYSTYDPTQTKELGAGRSTSGGNSGSAPATTTTSLLIPEEEQTTDGGLLTAEQIDANYRPRSLTGGRLSLLY